ncbi:MAG: hypothetical protein O2894_13375, partial [Planctomycetota bacterium]|nr:hypothetical protein [Planctomycetota bacterium]
MTFEDPLLLWAIPGLALIVALLEVRGGVWRFARFAVRTTVLACAVLALAGPVVGSRVPRERRIVLAVDVGTRQP